ncbi:putative rad21/Rec8-like protein [Lupinus albus]|uniref:Putative rad21/Rec8-like protein n=1 Tax=Lupinus albus TaxID=3870 RepID=A0A6A4R5X3_LUPAL|nr:putative rad21/Rec8-like protein [Lupinus albus]
MFYSHTFLARKGPLSTVWIAAHLQHRLKKSHYTSTDIPSTVQHIMDPGVPIALRMSGHLLLGVVRIYSKKVDYLFHDCNAVLTGLSKAFASIQLTLPEDARKAPVQSITLPNTFDLDALNLDDGIDHNGVEDIHMRSLEDITLTDQIPVAMDPYVAISFDEDMIDDSSHTEVLPDSGARTREEDTIPQSPSMDVAGFQDRVQNILRESPTAQLAGGDHQSPSANVDFQDRGQSIQRDSPTAQPTGGDHPHNLHSPQATIVLGSTDDSSQATVVLGPTDDSSPKATMPVEIIRDANNDRSLENPLVHPDLGDGTEPNRDLDQIMNEKDHIEIVDDRASEGMPALSQQRSGPQTPVNSQGTTLDAEVGVGHSAPNLMLAESPPNQQQQRRGRKRKQFFDEPIVLTNKFMRGALNNTHDILRKRRDMPSSTLGTWKLNNSRRKEHIFDQPLLTGFCKDLLDISNKEHICSKPHLAISEEDHADAGIDRTPPTNQTLEEPIATTLLDTEPTLDMEIEHLRNITATPPFTIPAHDVGTELNVEGDCRSPIRGDDLSSVSAQRLRSVSVSTVRTNIATRGIMQTPDLTASLGVQGSEMETPMMTNLDDRFPNFDLSETHQSANSAETENFGLSDTHQLINSAETEDLSFLEADANTPSSSQGTSTGINLSARTRAVAQYLKNHSPITPIMEEPAEDLSLNKILKGKTRKLSARMFYEVLVLKNHGLIDVQQNEPYGDISLKLTPSLSKDHS